MKGYCNLYDGDFGICHVFKLSNSKNIKKIETKLVLLLFNCRFIASKNADIGTTFVKSAVYHLQESD